jgi:rare lipoprotein A (peptidoglycan hydrolase)
MLFLTNPMIFSKTISILFAGALLFSPVQARAISSINYSTYTESPDSTIEFDKWLLRKNFSIAASIGEASWYGPGFYGRPTASGEIYRPGTFTVAHRTLPMGTRVRITNLNNGRSAIARVNDRGPYVGGRIVDLGEGIANHLGVKSSGVADVRLQVLD